MRGERVVWLGSWSGCWLAQFAPGVPCEGRLVRAHLIPKQRLKRDARGLDVWDERVWAPACGGLDYGADGHHGMLDRKQLRVPRAALPVELEDLAAQLGLGWSLDNDYGLKE